MRRFWLAAQVLLLGFVGSAFAAPFQNGSFELGTLPADPCNDALIPFSTAITGWTVNAGDINYVTGSTPTCWQPAEGNRSLDLIGNGSSGGGITQTFDTVPGQTYQVIFHMGGNPGAFPPTLKSLNVTVNGVPHNYTFETSSLLTTVQPTNMHWIQYSLFFTTPIGPAGTSSTISFLDTSGSSFAGAALDNVRVQPVGGFNVGAWGDVTAANNVHSGNSTTYPANPQVCAPVASGGTWNSINNQTYPLTITDDGIDGTFIGSYNVPQGSSASGICGSWTTTATAPPTFTGDVVVLWDYRGDHSSFNTTVDLQAFLIPGPSSSSTPFNTYIVTGSANGTKFQYNGQFTFTVQPGDTYGFTMTGSNFDSSDALRGTFTGVVMEQPAAPTLAAPVLIRALPSGSAVIPLLNGRLDGASNTPISVRLWGGTTCTNGVLGGAVAQIGADTAGTTDVAGNFGISPSQNGAQGQFVAIQVVSPQVTPLSACAVTAAANDSWPKALRLFGDNATLPMDWIDVSGRTRWYRFSVLPGQTVQVTLAGLPADYDVAVFKDIAVEFLNALAPENTAELTKLSAQYAPSAFSPSAFSPSAFSPSAFSPSAFSDTALSPSAFSPSAFSPSAFSPSAFSPSAFSPSAFSPSAFSPSAFSPSAFSPSAFSDPLSAPSAFSPSAFSEAFSSAQTRSIIAASMTPGTGSESVVVNTWNNTGDFYVRVTGRAGAFSTSPYNLAVTKQGTSCVNVTDTAISTRGPALAGGHNTIVLVDETKTSLSAALPGGGTLGSKLTTFMARPDVLGVKVNVAADSRVGQLKTQASNNLMCPFAKNLIASEIKSIIDAYRLTNPLKYVVILGNDDAIPFFRYPDQTLLGQESGYVPPVSSNSASEASLRGNFVLSQDGYGAATHISLGATAFPIPGAAVGRLVETPAEISGMIDAYIAVNGSVSPTSSLVTGYDFLQDAADAVRTELQLGTGNTPSTLITANDVSPADTNSYPLGPWKASDLRDKLLSTRYDVMFLAGHFNANSALAADFKSSIVTSELAGFPYLANALVFSAGCHAGYNLVDTDAISGVTFPLDWAQAFAQKKVTLVAGTGYQYGDTEFLEYSERLYLNFAKQLRAGNDNENIAIGEALVRAKRAYLAATSDVRGLHAKAVLEATLFGLPMLSVNMPGVRTGISTNNSVINATLVPGPSPANTLGLHVANLPVSPTLTPTVQCPDCGPHSLTLTNYEPTGPATITATWLSGTGGVVTNPAEPALPLQSVNVTPIDSELVLRGVGFRGATYSDSTVFPLTGAPTTELRGVHTPFSSPLFFPMRLWTTNYFSALSGGNGTSLLVTPAQHRAFDATNSTLRQYSGLDLRLFYSDLTNDIDPDNAAAVLSDAPTIVRVDAVVTGPATTFSAQVVGNPAAAIHEVWVTYTDGAGGSNKTWTSVDLQQCVTPLPAVCGTTSDSQYWKGAVETAALPPDTKYIVQAVNGTGLVSLDDNLGRYYSYAVGAPAPVATTLAFSPPVPTGAAFGDSLSITAVLSAGASPVANKVVTIAAGGGARTGTTNGAGSVTVQLPMLSPPGTYPLSASFGGDSAYLPSAASAALPVTVTKAAATLATPTSGVGAVLTGGTQPIAQESVQFLISGPPGVGVQQVFAITDYTGRATIPPPGFPSGTYSVIQACFAGNATYTAAKLYATLACPYLFAGFFQPVDNLPTLNSMKAGSAIPVKFGLGGNYGLNIFVGGSPTSQTIACNDSAVISSVEETVTSGGSTLSYDSASGRYDYVWKTGKAWAGTCRQLVLNFTDGTTQRANFKFVK